MPSSTLPSPNLNLHALIIGIDEYADKSPDSFKDLECAVSDAKSIAKFLETSLHVSSSHILTLFDSAATRSNILSSFASHLLNNVGIEHGDPILVYFAGHGTRYLLRPREREKYNTDDGNYEAICPHDRGCIGTDSKKVRDIRDSTLGEMLLELSLAKGNNITVILDCCHSGSGTRGIQIPREAVRAETEVQPEPETETERVVLRPRFAPPLTDPDILAEMLAEELVLNALPEPVGPVSRHMAYLPEFRHPSLSTHILLSACRQDEVAYEGLNHSGLFTEGLLKALEAHRSRLHTITYTELFDDLQNYIMPFGMQHPQCEGRNAKDWAIFNGRAVGVNRGLVPVVALPPNASVGSGEGGEVVLKIEAGELQGVALGTEFAIWPDKLDRGEQASSALTLVVATQVYATFCLAIPLPSAINRPSSTNSSIAGKRSVPSNTSSSSLPTFGSWAGVTYWSNAQFPIRISFDPRSDGFKRQRELRDKVQRFIRNDREDGRNGIEVVLDLVPYPPSPNLAIPLISISDTSFTISRPIPDSYSDMGAHTRTVAWPCKRSKDALDFLNRVLRFEYHLARYNPARPFSQPNPNIHAYPIEIQLLRLHPITGNVTSKNLLSPAHDLSGEGEIEQVHARLLYDDSEYVFRLTNHSDVDLYVAMYYFDPAMYTVSEMYTPPASFVASSVLLAQVQQTLSAGGVATSAQGGGEGIEGLEEARQPGGPTAPTLRSDRSLTIGDPASGVEPFCFTLDEDAGETEDTGYVKIWVAESIEGLSDGLGGGLGMVEEGEGWEEDVGYGSAAGDGRGRGTGGYRLGVGGGEGEGEARSLEQDNDKVYVDERKKRWDCMVVKVTVAADP